MKCYLCDKKAISAEHVPAKCLFPSNKRKNLITVPSCEEHNEKTSNDDEYIRAIISMTRGVNQIGSSLFLDKGVRSLNNSPGLYKVVVKNPMYLALINEEYGAKGLTYELDRSRFDKAIKKIAYGLYYHKYKSTWQRELVVSTKHFVTKNNEPDDIAKGILKYSILKESAIFEGNNPDVFKYTFLEFKGRVDKFLLLIFYDHFETWILPVEKTTTTYFK